MPRRDGGKRWTGRTRKRRKRVFDARMSKKPRDQQKRSKP